MCLLKIDFYKHPTPTKIWSIYMSKDNNKLAKSQAINTNSNTPNTPPTEDFLESYTNNSYWDEHKANTDNLSNLYSYNKKFERYAERTKTCSEFLVYANRLDLENGELVKKLTNANFCRVRLCPVCQWRRSLMWQARFYDAIPKIMEQYKGYRFLFLTLTVKNCPVTELSNTLVWMNKSFRKMLKYKKLDVWQGWLKTTEVTRNVKDNTAHPHFHILIMVKPSYFKKDYISQFEYVEMWQKALKINYLPNVDIRTVKNKHNNKEDLETAVQELLKYSVKEADLLADPQFLYILTEEIFKKRFISSGGILKNILKENDENPEDFLTNEELENIENIENEEDSVVFKFNRNFNKYTKKRVTNGITYQDQAYRQYKHNKIELNKILKERRLKNTEVDVDVDVDVPTLEVTEGGELKWN